jgi:hypothetical protein
MIKIGLSELEKEMTSGSVTTDTASLSPQQLVNLKGFELFATKLHFCIILNTVIKQTYQ